VLGLEKGFDFEKDGKVVGFYAKAGERAFIEIFKGEKAPEKAGGLLHFCLEARDVNEVERALARHGVESWGKSLGADDSWQLWCKDPSGNRIEFHQYTDRSSQLTGRKCVL